MNPPFLKFPISFSLDRLKQDLHICEQEHWKDHFNTADYQGEWMGIALRSASGNEQDIVSIADQSFADTPLLNKCLYFKEIIQNFECKKQAVRLLRLAGGSVIKEHKDNDTSYEEGFFRLHIPILTSDKVIFKVGGERVPMLPGECWYANFQLIHSVENLSDEPRVHLVIDCLRNQWSDQLFSSQGFDLSTSTKGKMSDEMKKKVIEELMRSGTASAHTLAESLKKELDS